MAQDTKKSVRREYSAGGVVFKITPSGPKIAFILDPFRKWAFAKGHIEKGETPREAALRETQEEMGLPDLHIRKYLGKMDFWFRDRFKRKGVLVHKLVYYYLMQAPPEAKAKPQKKEKIKRVRWVALERAPKVLSYENSGQILKKAINAIKQLGIRDPAQKLTR